YLLHVAGQSVSAAEYSASLASWDTAAEKMATFHSTYDFYITPATAYTAPKVGELTHTKGKQEELATHMHEIKQHEQQQPIYDMLLPSLTYNTVTQPANSTRQTAIATTTHLHE